MSMTLTRHRHDRKRYRCTCGHIDPTRVHLTLDPLALSLITAAQARLAS